MIRRRQLFPLSLALMMLLNAMSLEVLGQDSLRSLSLDEAISATLHNSKAIQLAKLDEKIAASEYKQTEAIYLPQVVLSYSAMNTNNPLNTFGFKLQQKSITQNDFNPDLLNHPSGTADFATQLEVRQPLVNMDMVYKRKAAQKGTELYKFKAQRTKEFLIYETRKAYLQLQFAYDAVEVLEDALQTEKSIYTFTDNHFKQGLIQKSDVLNVQVQVTAAQSSLAKAKSNIQNASDYLSLLMGQAAGIVYTIHKSLISDSAVLDTVKTISSARADFLAMQKAIEASDLLIKSDKVSYFPRLNAFGNYQVDDSRMLGFGASSYLAGIQLSWDIFKGNKTKNTITTQTLDRNKLSTQLAQQKDQSQLELNLAWRDISDAQFAMQQQNAAIELASESLRILRNRYAQGLVNTTEVLQAETQLLQQKLALAQTVFTLNVTKANLQYLTASSN